MTITHAEAVEIARRHGLGLTDAAALARLAETLEEAEQVADLLAPPDDAASGAARMNARIRQQVADAQQRRGPR